MPNTPARLTLALSAQAGNVLQFGADQGLLSPDQIGASGAADGPAALHTIPNHVSAAANKWWRSWTPLSNGTTFAQNITVVQPLLVAKSAPLQALALCTPNSNGAGSPVYCGIYRWTGEGLKFDRVSIAYVDAYPAGTTVATGYLNSPVALTGGYPYLVASASPTSYYCYAKQALPPLWPQKTAQPTDVAVAPGMSHAANAAYLPDTAVMASIDLDNGIPVSWNQTSFVPSFYYRLGAPT